MKEVAEFRIDRDFAHLLPGLAPPRDRWDIVATAKVDVRDPRYAQIGQLDREVRRLHNKPFFYGWSIRRSWTRQEWGRAEAAWVAALPVFEPAGEECGTLYDETLACDVCGAGAAQISDLVLDLRKVPNGCNFARTIAREVIVSQELAERLVEAGLTGFTLRQVRHTARQHGSPMQPKTRVASPELLEAAHRAGIEHGSWRFGVWANRQENRHLAGQLSDEHDAQLEQPRRATTNAVSVWYQLTIAEHRARIAPPTKTGIGPFNYDPDGKYRCPRGHVAGFTLLSMLHLERASLAEVDIQATEQYLGYRQGLLRPYRPMILSPRFVEVLQSMKGRRPSLELVELV